MLKRKSVLFILFTFSSLLSLSGQRVSLLSGEQEGIFSIEFPGEPTARTDTAYLGDTPVIIEKYSMIIENDEGESAELIASISEYPPGFIHSDSTFFLIDGFLNSTILPDIESEKVELLTSSHQFINGFPGKSFKSKLLSNGWRNEKQVYLVENYLIVLETISEKWFWKKSSNFLESFQLQENLMCENDYGLNLIDEVSYRVNFPDSTELRRMIVDSEAGPISTVMEIMERKIKMGNIVFMASEAGYPKSVFRDSFSLASFYEGAITGSLNSTNASLIDKKEITLAGFPGYQYSSSMFNGNATGVYQIVLIEERMYMTGVITLTKGINPEIEAFFHSFQLKE
jgi:hypothetical protein